MCFHKTSIFKISSVLTFSPISVLSVLDSDVATPPQISPRMHMQGPTRDDGAK